VMCITYSCHDQDQAWHLHDKVFEAPGGCRSGACVATIVTRSTLIKGSEVWPVIL
jgi:hypothetical protein